jgi:hypothetical protein
MVNILKPGRKFRSITIEVDEHGQVKVDAREFPLIAGPAVSAPMHPLAAAEILSQLTATLITSTLKGGQGAAQQQTKENPS